MKKSRYTGRHSWLCCAVCVICAALIKPVQDPLDTRLAKYRQDADLLFFSSPDLVKKMALGYDGLLADLYWMRTIQYYGRREEADKRSVRYRNLFTLLDITTTLDPRLLDAYRAGSCFLAEADPVGVGKPQDALKLLDKGIQANPEEWRLQYDKGFVYYWYLRDYKAAGEVWKETSRLPGAPHWIEGLAALSLSKGGSLEIAAELWKRQYQESNRADVRENARNHLISIQVSRDLSQLQILAEQHKAQTGAYPASLSELQDAQGRALPVADPLGTSYDYDPGTGTARLSSKSQVRYIRLPQ